MRSRRSIPTKSKGTASIFRPWHACWPRRTTPTATPPQFDFDEGQLVVPEPPTSREEIQEPFVREQEIDPAEYYPYGYHPELLDTWPVDGDLVVPADQMPPQMLDGMSQSWQQRQAYKKHIADLTADASTAGGSTADAE